MADLTYKKYGYSYENDANMLLLGDFNTDLLELPPARNNITFVFRIEQVLDEVIITKSSDVLIDYIHINNRPHVSNIKVVDSSISDHCAIFYHWSINFQYKIQEYPTVTLRSFKHFNETFFLVSCLPFADVYGHSDPDKALSVSKDTIKPVIDRHSRIQLKRLKAIEPCSWLSPELKGERTKRD